MFSFKLSPFGVNFACHRKMSDWPGWLPDSNLIFDSFIKGKGLI